MSQHWVPRHKWQLVQWLRINAGMKESTANKMKIAVLYAIFYKTLAKRSV